MNTLFKTLIIFMLTVGQVWGGVDFDGVDDSIDLGSSQDNYTKMTITAWVYPVSEGEGGVGTIWIKDAAGTTRKDFRFNTVNNLFFRVARGGGAFSLTSADNVLPNGAWAHVAVVWDGGLTSPTTQIVFYVNGVEVADGASNTASGGLVDDGTATEHVGNRASDAQTWDGDITEFCQWNDALTANEILFLAKSRVKRSCLQVKPSTLGVYLPLDEISSGNSADAATFINLKSPGTSNGTGDNGADNLGMTAKAEEVVSYPSNF